MAREQELCLNIAQAQILLTEFLWELDKGILFPILTPGPFFEFKIYIFNK